MRPPGARYLRTPRLGRGAAQVLSGSALALMLVGCAAQPTIPDPSTLKVPTKEIVITEGSLDTPHEVLGRVDATLGGLRNTDLSGAAGAAKQHLRNAAYTKYGERLDAIIDVRTSAVSTRRTLFRVGRAIRGDTRAPSRRNRDRDLVAAGGLEGGTRFHRGRPGGDGRHGQPAAEAAVIPGHRRQAWRCHRPDAGRLVRAADGGHAPARATGRESPPNPRAVGAPALPDPQAERGAVSADRNDDGASLARQPGSREVFQINLALTDMKTGTVVARASSLARDEDAGHDSHGVLSRQSDPGEGPGRRRVHRHRRDPARAPGGSGVLRACGHGDRDQRRPGRVQR